MLGPLPYEEQDQSSYSVVSAERQQVQLPTETRADAWTTPREGQDQPGTPRWFHQRASSSPTAGAALRRLRRVAQARRRMGEMPRRGPAGIELGRGEGSFVHIIVMDPM